MTPNLILHVGTYKTGTTSLQYFLYQNRDLLRAKGLYRPMTGAVDEVANWGHHPLVQSLNRKGPHKEWRDLAQECAGQTRVVVSSELFCNIRRASVFAPVRRTFEGWSKTVVIYLRPQDEYLESLYNHHVKSVGETRDIAAFTEVVAKRLDYLSFLRLLARAFGEQSLIVRPYESGALKGDICEDFLDTLGMDMPPEAQRHQRALNPGLTAEGIALMLQANRDHGEDKDRLAKIRQQIIARHPAPPHYQHSFLDDESRQAILKTYRAANRRIARTYLDGQNDLFRA